MQHLFDEKDRKDMLERDRMKGQPRKDESAGEHLGEIDEEDTGSRHDRTEHSGSRNVTEGTTVGTESGGTRNYRQGSGTIGTDIGNRPE
jgi:hypothetical protein